MGVSTAEPSGTTVTRGGEGGGEGERAFPRLGQQTGQGVLHCTST